MFINEQNVLQVKCCFRTTFSNSVASAGGGGRSAGEHEVKCNLGSAALGVKKRPIIPGSSEVERFDASPLQGKGGKDRGAGRERV